MFAGIRSPEDGMFDLLYLAMTAAFFAAMLWYTHGLSSLGRGNGESKDER